MKTKTMILLFISTLTFAAETDYPELTMTPRYSERLRSEAKKEDSMKWTQHLPLQISGATTFLAGIMQMASPDKTKDETGMGGLLGIGIGGAWLGTTYFLSQSYRPYTSQLSDLDKMPNQTPRDRLARERFAETVIEDTSSLAKKLTWMSFGTNLGACAYMFTKAAASSLSQIMDLSCVVFATTPILFKSNWIKVAHEQRNYKKNIYGPIASHLIEFNSKTGQTAAGLKLSFLF